MYIHNSGFLKQERTGKKRRENEKDHFSINFDIFSIYI